ncbi:N-acetylmuramoyl-L-alanine amidase [Clostridium sp. 'deep sea']|uniref:N-acetylmuramoyl-L-alanine amidase n=1 Tax=Clostridium sp. 'deep sea' TaxID=2779445 RepID=UPI0018966081|nr:N-acetylmuramoyl-L-alanine amidase [Clostridium sp. 'deep sea']QOR36399.1 N-acetylmuramoyl-L-alanine amidase [Clostridium sp. 'deep sea']
MLEEKIVDTKPTPEEPPKPDEPKPNNNVDKSRLQISVPNLKDYKLKSLFQEPQAPVYGVISSARVNLRTEPSTADSKTVRVTVDGGTKLQVIGQSFGWYNVIYKNEELWVADWLLSLDLKMKRNNVNVRQGPGTTYAVVDMVMRDEHFKVLERKPDWVKVKTKNGKEGFIAEWLVAINDRLIEVENDSQDVAKELTFSLKNTNINEVSFSDRTNIIKSVTKKAVGNDVEVKINMAEAIAYNISENNEGLEIEFGAALTDLQVSENEGRVTLNLSFDKPTKFTVFQNLLEKKLVLDFPNSIAVKEQTKQLNNKIASAVKLNNKPDSAVLEVSLNNLGSYKVNTAGFSKNVQLVLLNSSLSGKVIALDAGHGGSRPGAYRGGIYEKEITLPVALKVQKILTDKGITVFMTRVNDKTVLLDERVDLVNGCKADLAVSIHVNDTRYGTGKASGVETWYYPKPENERLAQCLQTGLLSATGFRNRGIKPSTRLRVTKNWKMPSALMEIGFMDNDYERNQLLNDKVQQKIAENIVFSIENFLRNE